ncbi:MAG TPA: hypothetical protein VKX45_18655 [Bryobacteraceae bacterium]|nr:hypothetical protein [Bryobacteraceae bacterium]
METIAVLPLPASLAAAEGQRDNSVEPVPFTAVHRYGGCHKPRSEPAVHPNDAAGLQKWTVK